MGAGDTADPPVASEQLGRSKLECAVAQQHGTQPNRLGQVTPANGADATPAGPSVLVLAVLEFRWI